MPEVMLTELRTELDIKNSQFAILRIYKADKGLKINKAFIGRANKLNDIYKKTGIKDHNKLFRSQGKQYSGQLVLSDAKDVCEAIVRFHSRFNSGE